MKPDEYVRLASVTMSGTNDDLDDSFMDNIHMMLGVMSESGEIADVFKKYLSYKTPIDWINVKEELGDLMWYIAGFCAINGFSLEEIMETNINKLKARFPEGFSEYDATHRDLDKERKTIQREIFEENGIEVDEDDWPLESCAFVQVIKND